MSKSQHLSKQVARPIRALSTVEPRLIMTLGHPTGYIRTAEGPMAYWLPKDREIRFPLEELPEEIPF